MAISRRLVRVWWKRAEKLPDLLPKPGRAWDSLRRKFASDLMHKPLKVSYHLGGWNSPRRYLTRYQDPDEDQLREALADRRTRGAVGS